MSGNHIAHAATRLPRDDRYSRRVCCYTMSGTDVAYAGTRPSVAPFAAESSSRGYRPMQCPALT
eukprot:1760466-Rhodomonas_salina.4